VNQNTDKQDYQLAIANPQQKKRFANLFSPRSRRQTSDNALHPSLARRKGEEQDFDKMLMTRSTTKKVSLGANNESTSIWHRERDRDPVSPIKPSGQSTPTQAIVRKRTKSTTNSHSHSRQEEDVNKTASFFSKNRVARRVKTNEDNRGRARKDREREREHEVEFEIHSASGVSSGDNSPNDRDGVRKVKKVDEEEKWMGMSPFSKRVGRRDC
jgi:hypothetical protein